MQEMTVGASPDQIGAVIDFVNEQLAALGCPEAVRIDVDVAVDELLGNIALYAYGPDAGTVTVRVAAENDPPAAVVTFMDRGRPFNPLAEERPDTAALPARERPIGGLGLFMARQLMDELAYSYRDGQNILTARKAI